MRAKPATGSLSPMDLSPLIQGQLHVKRCFAIVLLVSFGPVYMLIYPDVQRILCLKLTQLQVMIKLIRFNNCLNSSLETSQLSVAFEKREIRPCKTDGSSSSVGDGLRNAAGIEDLYKTYIHRNVFNDKKFKYRLTLTSEEQWKIVQNNRSGIFVPRSSSPPKTERELARFEHLDLLSLQPPTYLPQFKNPCWYDDNKLLRCLPYFYLIGAPKCGTTDLHKKLENHQDFLPSRTKEPHWFTRGRFERNLSEFRFTDYLAYFSDLSGKLNNAKLHRDMKKHLITGDCSASTMWDNSEWTNLPRNNNPLEPIYTTADYIHHLNPATKIIFILRNPTNRLYSDYLYFEQEFRKSPANFHRKVVDAIYIFTACLRTTSLRSCVYNKNLEQYLEVRLHIGIYFIFLTEWYRRFPRRQILPLNLEEYSRSINTTMVKIFNFLQMRMPTEAGFHKMVGLQRANIRSDRNINVGPMWRETRQILYKFYKPFNQMLANLLQDKKFDYGFS